MITPGTRVIVIGSRIREDRRMKFPGRITFRDGLEFQ